jgi:hypothetical protein
MLRPSSSLALGCFLAAAAVACRQAPAPTRPPALPPTTGDAARSQACGQNLAGRYVHASSGDFRYVATDDGRTLRLMRAGVAADGGVWDVDPSAPVVTLKREASAFRGSTVASIRTTRGGRCEAQFPTEVIACDPGGLTLRSAARMSVDDNCRVVGDGRAQLGEHRLVRQEGLPALSRDGGFVDAAREGSDGGTVADGGAGP